MNQLTSEVVRAAYRKIRGSYSQYGELSMPSEVCAYGAFFGAILAMIPYCFRTRMIATTPHKYEIERVLVFLLGDSTGRSRDLAVEITHINDGLGQVEPSPEKALGMLYFRLTGKILEADFWQQKDHKVCIRTRQYGTTAKERLVALAS